MLGEWKVLGRRGMLVSEYKNESNNTTTIKMIVIVLPILF